LETVISEQKNVGESANQWHSQSNGKSGAIENSSTGKRSPRSALNVNNKKAEILELKVCEVINKKP
jgi:hypothetical protein